MTRRGRNIAAVPADEARTDGAGTPSVSTIARGASWTAASNIAGQVVWFASLIVLGALLPPKDFGIVAFGLLVTTAATRLMEAGTHGDIIVREQLTRADLRRDLVLNVRNGILLACVIALAAKPLVESFATGGQINVLRALGLSTALYAFSIVPLAVIDKRLEFKRRAWVQGGAMAISAVVSILLGIAGAGVWALVLRQLLYHLLLALLAWIAARDLLPKSGPRMAHAAGQKRRGARAFLAFTLSDYAVFNLDVLIVGNLTGAAKLGLYSLAFTIASAPMKQISAQIGIVLFPAAALTDDAALARRTLTALRIGTALMAPIIPVTIALAPVVVPWVLGDRWEGMVTPLQILIVVMIAHAIMNLIGESLSARDIGWRARVNVVWAVAMAAALLVLVNAVGMVGAAWAHLLLYVPVVVAYTTAGARRVAIEPVQLRRALVPLVAALLVQAAVTAAITLGLQQAGVAHAAAAVAGTAAGLAATAVALTRLDPELLAQSRRLVAGLGWGRG